MCAYVQSRCATMTGVAQCTVGRPTQEQLAEAALPWVIIGAPQPRWEPWTFAAGGAGLLATIYPVNIVVVMGPANLEPADAEAAREVWADRVRGALSSDPSLGGRVFDSELESGIDNVDTYRRAGQEQQPQCAFRLVVTEVAARNAAVA